MQGWYGLGRIGKDAPKQIDTKSGTSMAVFSMAIDDYNPSKQESETTWLDVKCFGKTAEFVLNHFDSGKPIFIRQGRVYRDEWVDKESGNKRVRYGIIADRIEFVPGAGTGNGSSGSSTSSTDGDWEGEDDEDIWDIDEDDDPFKDN